MSGYIKSKKTDAPKEDHLEEEIQYDEDSGIQAGTEESAVTEYEEYTKVQTEDEEEKEILVCEIVRAMDFTVKEPKLDITPEENQMYLEGYLKVLKNEIPVISKTGEEKYYKDLWRAGIEFEELLKERGAREFPYQYYYDDLDGDGKPEFAFKQGCVYLLKYELDLDQCRILDSEQTCYFKKIVGAGQIWCHDGLHAGMIRDRLVALTEDGSFQEVLILEEGVDPEHPYYKVGINDRSLSYVTVSEGNWNDVTAPFFEMVENNGLPVKTLEEVFGNLLKESIP